MFVLVNYAVFVVNTIDFKYGFKIREFPSVYRRMKEKSRKIFYGLVGLIGLAAVVVAVVFIAESYTDTR